MNTDVGKNDDDRIQKTGKVEDEQKEQKKIKNVMDDRLAGKEKNKRNVVIERRRC